MHGFPETFEGELFGVGFDGVWIEAPFVKVKNGVSERFPGLFVKKDAGDAIDDGFERSAFFVGDDRATCCHGFHWRETEVFFMGIDEGDSVCKKTGAFGVGDSSNEGNVLSCHGAEFFLFWAVTEDNEGNTEFIECGDDEVVAFIRY